MHFDQSLWSGIKDNILLKNPGNKLVESWMNPINFIGCEVTGNATKISLSVPSPLHKYFVMENLLPTLYSEVSANFPANFEIDLKVTQLTPSELPNQQLWLQESNETSEESFRGQPVKQSVKVNRVENINLDYTFNTFVVGRNTEFAHAACFNVARNPGSDGYNPLFIYGPVGMGKTHLLNAVGNEILTRSPNLRITYLSAETFLNQCINYMRQKQMDRFRQKYREDCDIFLVDDVQYIGKTEAVQEEFFHLINSFIEKRKQVVVASDRMPRDIIGLEDRSRSRLEWGLIADISMPDFETRSAILKYKAEKMNIHLSDDVVSFVARISKRSIREIEGNLKRIKMFSELQALRIDLDLVKKVLANHESISTISLEDIQKIVADFYKIKVSDLKATTRARPIVVPRQVAMYLIKKHLDKSLVDIGRAFGGKDHTTVMNAIERVSHLQLKDVGFKNEIDDLNSQIHNITGI